MKVQKVQNPNRNNQDIFIKALERTMGIISQACEASGLSRNQVYMWMKDEEFQKRMREVSERTLDFVESMMIKQIKGGNTFLTWKFLSTKGRHRGYTESAQLDIQSDQKIFIIQDDAAKNAERIIKLEEGLKSNGKSNGKSSNDN